ncbi:hypothetical protein BASA50_011041 [Batrachochytrium salamandrivorans]|uniref:FAR-17a/AIG1-like protein n=1 Tax=Batrachochytrium salamandrivorans TaxID=1357716 RepID=A0ABQ8EWT3_9FUNG|nr:hypothetical protein BASA62_006914 [Batrachochytrium salamandrivorans]KAH6577497.1 hypothetical protein BASA60_003978 [Batrachochytrium salamandrivorans]KAH6581836.1 hypothetical protein BASA61_008843 [Batrachochytrium salamandrivorans]KAH6587850.1 hypothetical protein BASA50_011041 [Batrachochytrium salamandrivorans]KAJ1340129.1 hypothetical protein BSLG_005266 [Batrachochytrium salamandrivorans]
MYVSDVVSSRLVSRPVLLAIRILFAIFTIVIMFWKISMDGPAYFRYLTTLSWTGIVIYYIVVVAVSLTYRNSKSEKEELPTWVSYLIQFTFSTSQMLPLIVTIIFWTLLRYFLAYADTSIVLFLMVTPHVANLFIAQVELWLTKQKLPLSRIAYTLLAILAYTILSWILNYCFGVEFPYRFFQDLLDIRATPGTSIGWSIAFLCIFFIMSLCIWAEARLRDYLMDRLFPRSDVVIDEPLNIPPKRIEMSAMV